MRLAAIWSITAHPAPACRIVAVTLPPALDSSLMVRASLAGPCPMTIRADDVEVTYLTEEMADIA
jgi:hypothetical protein